MPDFEPPDAEELERELRDLFQYGDIKRCARYARMSYDSLAKQLNPNEASESIPYQMLMLYYGAECAREGLGDAVWAVMAKHKPQRPSRPTASTTSLETAFFNFRALLAAREDGRATPEEVEAARERLAEITASVGRGKFPDMQVS